MFHEDWKINVASRVLTRKNAPPPGGHVFQPTGIIFKLIQDIIGMNLLTKKNVPPLGSHVFQANVKIFELIQDIIETNLLYKFHEDWTINVASRELKRQMLTPHKAQRTTDITRSQKLTMSRLCSTICRFTSSKSTQRDCINGRNKGKPVQSKLTLPTKHKLYVSGRSTINTFCIRNYTTWLRESLAMNSDIM
ncbi:hypothetical protein DPMN_009742 [Dreissena polymorpha]|uniref:Uncharacterized protein n=1 Tax=Dreissena polymorpha TaxID=45954 RepID=A0A9D4N0V5_DREPO|nr:hypothetical protein DPMN_009742 [Dreissena polymorpha]